MHWLFYLNTFLDFFSLTSVQSVQKELSSEDDATGPVPASAQRLGLLWFWLQRLLSKLPHDRRHVVLQQEHR